MDKFTSIDFITSFPGMILTVVLLTQVFKRLFDKVINHQTKFVVFGFSLGLCILAASIHGDFTSPEMIIQTVVVWLVNTMIIWSSAMKSFEVIAEPKSATIYIKNKESEASKDAIKIAMNLLQDHKNVKLKMDPNVRLSRE